MSVLASIAAARPQPLHRHTFDVFTIVEGPIRGEGKPLPLGTFVDEDEAIRAGRAGTAHKSQFLICDTDNLTGGVMLRFYAVKRKSKPVYRYHDYQTRAVHDLYSELVATLDVTALPQALAEGARS